MAYDPRDYDETQEPGFDPGPSGCGEEDECSFCGEIKVLGFGKYEDECIDCEASAIEFAEEDAAIRRAEGGYGYSGGWSGHEPAYLPG